MTSHYRVILSILFCAVLAGCATIFNGSTQDVPVIMPEGTQVSDGYGSYLMVIHHESGNTSLRLKRKKDYSLRFLYNGKEANVFVSSSFEPGWIVADFFTDLIGYIVDGITGAWNSFDSPIIVHFPADTSKVKTSENVLPFEAANEIHELPKIGIAVAGKIGLVFPMTEFVGNVYGLSVGYHLFHSFTLFLGAEGGSAVDILPSYSNYTASGSYTQLNLECRLQSADNLYLALGGGTTRLSSGNISYSNYGYDSLGRRVDLSMSLPVKITWLPHFFAGIGMLGNSTYFELRHTIGFSNPALPHDEFERFETTSLVFGLNLDF